MTEFPPPDDRLKGLVKVVAFPLERKRPPLASVVHAIDLDKASTDDEIGRLSKLKPVEYACERKPIAKQFGLGVGVLDGLVQERRKTFEPGPQPKQGTALDLADPTPWQEPVDGSGLLDDLAAVFKRHIVLSNVAADTLALWAVHTFLIDWFSVSPRLAITSPEKGCGKTTLLDVLYHLVMRPLLTANASVAATFRIVAAKRPTLLIDEADTFLTKNDELRGILNSGHRQNGAVIRTVGDDLEPRKFRTYSACAIAMIGKLPPTLADRSVMIELRRRLPDEKIEGFRFDRTAHLEELARRTARWAMDNVDPVKRADPEMPAGVNNRAADNWRPLLAIADAAGGEWSERARRSALGPAADRVAEDSVQLMLLADIRAIFDKLGVDRLPSATILTELMAREDRPWGEYRNGAPISPAGIAKLLSPFKIFSGTIRTSGSTPKGYYRSQFGDAFQRYLPTLEG